MPTYGERRRVPGLRREEVASLAGVSFGYYALTMIAYSAAPGARRQTAWPCTTVC
jgi:hypothetical protein